MRRIGLAVVLVVSITLAPLAAQTQQAIMGYALAAYVAIPNFGLLVESSIPGDATRRHALVSNLPLITYITVAVVFAFAIPY